MFRQVCIVALVVLAAIGSLALAIAQEPSTHQLRTWTDSTGKYTIQAEFVDSKDGKVRLKKQDGKEVTIPVEKLSDADREFVRQQSKGKPVLESAPKKLAVDLGGGVNLEMVLIPAGEFMMGSRESAEATAAFFNKPFGEDLLKADGFTNEHPQHRVRITRPFYLGTYHVTRGQFRKFVEDTGYKTDAENGNPKGGYGWNPDKKAYDFSEKYSWRNTGFEQTDQHPVVNVTWNDAVAFCKGLSRKEDKTYRLPTEAEWEYACRAGTTTRYYSGDDPETLAKVGNVADATHRAKFPKQLNTIKASDGYVFTSPVGSFKPNTFGLYDMHGNARQWCADWYGENYYDKSPADDPTGPDSGVGRVIRGSSWNNGPDSARSALRNGNSPDYRLHITGFRVARTQ
ncbi:MAG: SUMF1/EgtB/PvdO family nonheme iron enzyme [Thermoguttaceae bacterium]